MERLRIDQMRGARKERKRSDKSSRRALFGAEVSRDGRLEEGRQVAATPSRHRSRQDQAMALPTPQWTPQVTTLLNRR